MNNGPETEVRKTGRPQNEHEVYLMMPSGLRAYLGTVWNPDRVWRNDDSMTRFTDMESAIAGLVRTRTRGKVVQSGAA